MCTNMFQIAQQIILIVIQIAQIIESFLVYIRGRQRGGE